MNIFSLDIGGAFIKSAYLPEIGRPKQGILPFKMYREPERLFSVLKKLKPKTKNVQTIVTMTGELCDSFATRMEGVRHIVECCVTAFGRETLFLGRRGELFTGARAKRLHEEVASANWVAIPLFLSMCAGMKDFLHVDIGSTTTDLTRVKGGEIANRGWDDFGRLANGELVYTGYLRTPLHSVSASVTVDGRSVPLSSEYFAVMGDVYLALGRIGAGKYSIDTPDGRGKTKAAALSRIARSVLSERGALGDVAIIDMAGQLAKAQSETVLKAASGIGGDVVVTGTGSFIAERFARKVEMVEGILPRDFGVSDIDPSLALALLAGKGVLKTA
ncbi:MAG: hypothetical protein OEY64_00420 [Nitrospinota bacterium]|nr:hypothetical protein [Nitrospinota bacterium]